MSCHTKLEVFSPSFTLVSYATLQKADDLGDSQPALVIKERLKRIIWHLHATKTGPTKPPPFPSAPLFHIFIKRYELVFITW